MKRWIACAVLSVGVASAQPVSDYGFEFVKVGDPGNSPYDRSVLIPLDRPDLGVVNYEYRISRNEVGSGQYLEFLNTFTTKSDDLTQILRQPIMWGGRPDPSYSGPGVRYVLRDDVPDPANQSMRVSWEDAARYINWLNNGKSSSPSAIENGAYDTSLFTQNPDNSRNHPNTHNPGVTYWLPTRDEWLKAAHWDPDKFGPGEGGWWMYSHGSDQPPVSGLPGEPGAETSAIDWMNQPPTDRLAQLMRVPLGSYPQTQSPWGLIDITGGSREWLETWANEQPFSKQADGAPAGGISLADLFETTDGTIPGSRFASIRIASVVPSPMSCAVLAGTSALTLSRRRRP